MGRPILSFFFCFKYFITSPSHLSREHPRELDRALCFLKYTLQLYIQTNTLTRLPIHKWGIANNYLTNSLQQTDTLLHNREPNGDNLLN